MYSVLQKFQDGENGIPYPVGKGRHIYEVGDAYPVAGFEPTEAHINYLLAGGKFSGPVIESAEDDTAKKAAEAETKKQAAAEKKAAKEAAAAEAETKKE